MFEPNYPEREENTYIEVYIGKTQKIYQFKDFDTSRSEIKIEDLFTYEEMRLGDKLRYVASPFIDLALPSLSSELTINLLALLSQRPICQCQERTWKMDHMQIQSNWS